MKLWLITQDKNEAWGTYDSAVVAAETMDQAKMIHPYKGFLDGKTHHSDWVDSPNDVEAEYLGEAKGARASGKES